MVQKIRRSTPTLIGGAVLLIVLDLLIAIYRMIGLDKAAAIYMAVLTFVGIAYLLARHHFKSKSENYTEK